MQYKTQQAKILELEEIISKNTQTLEEKDETINYL